MGFFKKRFEKNVTHDNEFLKDYAVKCNGLMIYAESNEKVMKELCALRDDFQYTMPSADSAAKGIEHKIKKEFDGLVAMLQQTDWDEAQVLLAIKGIRRYVFEIGSLR